MVLKLHRCPNVWLKVPGHPCWRVQKALDQAGIEYEIVNHPLMRGRREEAQRVSGQRLLPFVQFEDGSVLREESKDLAARIRAGNLRPAAPPTPGDVSSPSF